MALISFEFVCNRGTIHYVNKTCFHILTVISFFHCFRPFHQMSRSHKSQGHILRTVLKYMVFLHRSLWGEGEETPTDNISCLSVIFAYFCHCFKSLKMIKRIIQIEWDWSITAFCFILHVFVIWNFSVLESCFNFVNFHCFAKVLVIKYLIKMMLLCVYIALNCL